MKSYLNLLMLAGVMAGAASCTDLDTPIRTAYEEFPNNDIATAGDFNKCYYYIRNEGWLGRNFWETVFMQGDEAMGVNFAGNYFDNGRYFFCSIHNMRPDHTSGGQEGDLLQGITYTNTVIRQYGGEDGKSPIVAPLRVIRAFYHFLFMDMYGDTPIMDRVISEDETFDRSPRAEVARWIEQELLEAIPDMKETNDETTYGIPNKWMAEALLVKLYINWGVYTNPITSVTNNTANEKLNDCVAWCDQIINSGLFEVGTGYRKKFFPDNGPQIKDFIYAIPMDPYVYGNGYWGGWQPNRFFDYRSSGLMDVGTWTWKPKETPAGTYVLIPECVDRFCLEGDERNEMIAVGQHYAYDANFNRTNTPIQVKSGRKYVDLIFTKDIEWVDMSLGDVGAESTVTNLMKGARLYKYPPLEEDYDGRWDKKGLQGNDIPVFRFADILLTKAEAIMRGATATGGHTPASLINMVRDCSHAPHISGAVNDIDTESLVKYYHDPATTSTDPRALMLEELYYSYGRYLLIGCSRGMDSPANLQGIWNHSASPEWQSDIHSNINVQMNYWPAEITNLSELHMPYLNYIYSMAIEHDEWKEYARRSGMSAGWTCFTQNNIFGHSDYAENYVIANAWYTSHLWQHYRYTLDREFLREKAMPVMKSCCDFWLERLVEASDGTLVAPAEWSPEHGPGAEDGTAHAQQIVCDLFQSTLKAIEILGSEAGVDNAFVAELTDKYNRLDKGLAIENYTGKWGDSLNGINSGDPILREWKYSDYTVGENGHRHQSHLMCLYPFAQVTPESAYFDAAVNSLRLRGDVSTGWSLGWRINLWARALDAAHAHSVLHNALRHATAYTSSQVAGGIYYNLFDSHAPFQIDGNFGYTAGVTEMLLQSYNDCIRLLPALPAEWAAGSLNGICAENNFTVSQQWEDGKLVKATIFSGSGASLNLIYEGLENCTVTSDIEGDVDFSSENAGNIFFPTVAGATYTLIPAGAGVSAVRVDNSGDAPVEYYNLQGIRVQNPCGGIYIEKKGNQATKRYIR